MVIIEFADGRTEEVKPMPIKDILIKFNLKESTTLVLMDGELVTQDKYAYSGKRVKIINVVSGG